MPVRFDSVDPRTGAVNIIDATGRAMALAPTPDVLSTFGPQIVAARQQQMAGGLTGPVDPGVAGLVAQQREQQQAQRIADASGAGGSPQGGEIFEDDGSGGGGGAPGLYEPGPTETGAQGASGTDSLSAQQATAPEASAGAPGAPAANKSTAPKGRFSAKATGGGGAPVRFVRQQTGERVTYGPGMSAQTAEGLKALARDEAETRGLENDQAAREREAAATWQRSRASTEKTFDERLLQQRQEAQAKLRGVVGERERVREEHAQMQMDPDAWWKEGGQARTIRSAIAVALSGLGDAIAGRDGPNRALEAINRSVDRNIAAQTANIAKKKGELDGFDRLYQQVKEQTGDEQAATLALKAEKLRALDTQIAASAAEQGSERAFIQARKLREDLQRQILTIDAQVESRVTREETYGWRQTGGGGGTARKKGQKVINIKGRQYVVPEGTPEAVINAAEKQLAHADMMDKQLDDIEANGSGPWVWLKDALGIDGAIGQRKVGFAANLTQAVGAGVPNGEEAKLASGAANPGLGQASAIRAGRTLAKDTREQSINRMGLIPADELDE